MQNRYLKNAALLTVSDVWLRLAGMGLRVYLANALGGEGMGLYQLVLAVYSLFVTLATSGVSVASTRLLAEELEQSPSTARGMLAKLLAAAFGLGTLAMVGQLALADLAARWWLGDVRAAMAIRAAAFGMPFMAMAAVLRGFFIARRQVWPNIASQLVEQLFRIGVIAAALGSGRAPDIQRRCAVVMGATAASEIVSAIVIALFYRAEARRCFGSAKAKAPAAPAQRIWEILWPVEGGRCLSSALHTAENMLVPACLTACFAAQGRNDGRSAAVAQYGSLKGMTLPLINFPFGLLGSLSVLLMPEITQAHIRQDSRRLEQLLNRMLGLTMYFSLLACTVFWVWGRAMTQAIYGSEQAGIYLEILAPAMPLLYLESMVDGAMKGIGEQKAVFRYSVWDSIARIAGVILLTPHLGMWGFLLVILLSSFYTCAANTRRLLAATGMQPVLLRWLGGPLLAGAAAALTGLGLRQGLGGLLCGGRWLQLAVSAAGSCGMALVYIAVAWPLGLGHEMRALRTGRARKA